MSEVDYAWAAGFYEGEGTIHLMKSGGSVVLAVNQVTLEPLERLVEIFGGMIYGPHSYNDNQPIYRWNVYNRQHAQQIILKMWPWLSQRRQEQAWSVFDRHQDRLDQQNENMLYCRKGLHLKSEFYSESKSGKRWCRACATETRKAWKTATQLSN